MEINIYFITAALFSLLVLSLLWALLYALHHVFRQGQLSPKRQKKILFYIGLGFFCWLSFLGLMAFLGFFENFQTFPPRLILAALPPMALIIALMGSKKFTKMLHLIPESWMIYVQSFRIPMELCLWLGYLGGFVPFQMTFEGLNYDILVGITALMAGFVFFGRGRYRQFEAIIWNISGITLLINVVLISTLSTPAPFRVFMNEPANRFIAYFPYIWIPGFVVPFAFAMHLFSLKQLILKGPRAKRVFLAGRKHRDRSKKA